MPGHGERFIETYEDWFVRINKRVQRLERRIARAVTTATPEPTLLTNVDGFSGAIYAMATAGVVQIWSATVSGTFPAGGTRVIEGTLPAAYRPRAGSGNRVGAAYMSGGYPGVAVVSAAGNVGIYHQAGSARTNAQFTVTFIP